MTAVSVRSRLPGVSALRSALCGSTPANPARLTACSRPSFSSATIRSFLTASPTRSNLRRASRQFAFVKPPPPPPPAYLDFEEGAEEVGDSDLNDLVDRSSSGRRLLFKTLNHLLTLRPASIDPSYVDSITEVFETTHSPLLPREVARCAEVWMHVGREDEAVKWVRKLIAHKGPLDDAVVEGLRVKARDSGAKGLERRLMELEQVVRQRQLQPQAQVQSATVQSQLPSHDAPHTSSPSPSSMSSSATALPSSKRSSASARSG